MKGKLGRVIWRRIGGRVVPIRISNTADKSAQASSYAGTKFRQIVAKVDGQQVGKLTLSIPKKGVSASVEHVVVEPKFREKGISKNLFARATQMLERIGKKFLRSEDIQAAAQIKIRRKYGRFKAGGKTKNRSRIIADGFPPYGEGTRRITKDHALEIMKNNDKGQLVKMTTMLKKRQKK